MVSCIYYCEISLNKVQYYLYFTNSFCLFIILDKRRAIYDQFGEEGLKGGVPDGSGGFTAGYTFHGDPFKVFSTFFGGNNPFAGKYDLTTNDIFRFCFVLEFFNGNDMPFFGGMTGRSQPKKDPPVTKDLFLTLEEVYSGCTKKMKISRRVRMH